MSVKYGLLTLLEQRPMHGQREQQYGCKGNDGTGGTGDWGTECQGNASGDSGAHLAGLLRGGTKPSGAVLIPESV